MLASSSSFVRKTGIIDAGSLLVRGIRNNNNRNFWVAGRPTITLSSSLSKTTTTTTTSVNNYFQKCEFFFLPYGNTHEQQQQHVGFFNNNNNRIVHFSSSPFDKANNDKSSSNRRTKRKRNKKKKFIPPKAAVVLTETSRTFFTSLLAKPPREEIIGIMLNYKQSSSGEPRMVFSFDFVTNDQIDENDEGVSLEVLEDGITPKSPKDSINDGLRKLYVNHNALIKVLGCTLDVNTNTLEPLLYDKEGNIVDPNVT